ncbi:MAG: TIGR00159 family protein [Verrucomicrobia bacterium]|nr:TIGR00159 family protein [Cytophagales bacterium]
MLILFYISFIEITWVDVLDIGLVGYLLFQLYKFMRDTIATRILIGFLVIYFSFLIARAAGMELMSSILEQFRNVGVVALLVLFQQEIRKFLLMVGKTTIFEKGGLFQTFPWRKAAEATHENYLQFTPIVEAAKSMAASHTGALIVFAKNNDLKVYADSGDMIDALVSKRLLLSVFNKHSPMHDGAMIIEKNRIRAARCILPVSDRRDIPANFGLRHRAAIGLSEMTDAVVLIISEETGQISLVKNGHLEHNLSVQELRSKLSHFILEVSEKTDEPTILTEVKEALTDLRGKQVEV